MADKVLRSLQPAAGGSGSGSVQYTGIEKFTYTTVQLALNNTTTTTNPFTLTPYSIHTALSLLTQFAHSYSVFNPSYGRYNGELKPPKAAKGALKKSGSAGSSILSHECVIGAVENLQRCILVSSCFVWLVLCIDLFFCAYTVTVTIYNKQHILSAGCGESAPAADTARQTRPYHYQP